MPSPIGHALAGAAVALAGDLASPSLRPQLKLKTRLVMLAGLAALPDLDLVYPPIHRAFTHSIGAVILITIVASAVTGWVTGRRSIGFAALCGAAWASHLLLDWLGVDPNPPFGIEAWWPFSDGWFIARWQIFPGTERRHVFTAAALATNLYAVALETGIMTPIILVLWRLRSRMNRADR